MYSGTEILLCKLVFPARREDSNVLGMNIHMLAQRNLQNNRSRPFVKVVVVLVSGAVAECSVKLRFAHQLPAKHISPDNVGGRLLTARRCEHLQANRARRPP